MLFIFADDQRADALGASGNTYIHTPNIDKIAHIKRCQKTGNNVKIKRNVQS